MKNLKDIYFSELYGITTKDHEKTNDLLKYVNKHISLENQQNMELLITEDEIYLVLNKTPRNSALGPDGYTYSFYKRNWEMIK